MISANDVGESEAPITVVVSRRVRKGQEAAFEALSAKMTEAAAPFPGHLGAVIFRPSAPDDPEYRIIYKFDSQAHLDRWLLSPERQAILEAIEELLEQPSAVDTLSGLVAWFTLPGRNPVQPPPKYKMTIVSWLALFPLVTLIFWAFGEQLAQLPLLFRTFLVTIVIMPLMSYVVMPRFTSWFAFWLFPKEQESHR
ncbi:MAG: antibiotic biosynthesis monooxygenase [Candidatus Sedimenticola sp. 1PA]